MMLSEVYIGWPLVLRWLLQANCDGENFSSSPGIRTQVLSVKQHWDPSA